MKQARATRSTPRLSRCLTIFFSTDCRDSPSVAHEDRWALPVPSARSRTMAPGTSQSTNSTACRCAAFSAAASATKLLPGPGREYSPAAPSGRLRGSRRRNQGCPISSSSKLPARASPWRTVLSSGCAIIAMPIPRLKTARISVVGKDGRPPGFSGEDGGDGPVEREGGREGRSGITRCRLP